jgi:hypothetical protein
MSWRRRKTAPRVRDGQVQHKNNWQPTSDHSGLRQVRIERRPPGCGYRHVLRRADICAFLQLLHCWAHLSRRLNRILLGGGNDTTLGWFSRGVVAVCAMPRNLTLEFDRECFYTDADFFDRLGVPYRCFGKASEGGERPEVDENEDWTHAVCQFTPATARCFQLLRVLTHELGHHYDLITNRRDRCTRGEEFAERYGQRLDAQMWPRYLEVFGDPRKGEDGAGGIVLADRAGPGQRDR